ncbi:MAG TPA: hypothetical protein VHA35_20505 [Dongiaceae bacterium]|jgi:hypothetical protein|nr:hypothetical protein [Dongiaceae bacterium]
MSRSALLGASFLAPVLLMVSMSATLAEGELATDQASSTFSMKPAEDGLYEVTTVNTRFETDFVPPSTGAEAGERGDIYQLVEIEETHVNKEGPGADGERVAGKVKATVYPLEKTGKGAAKFTIEAEGDESKVDGPYLTVTRWGCCALSSTDAVYSLQSGKYLFNSTGYGPSFQWTTLTSKNFERILAFHVAPTEMDDVVLKGAPNAAIVIAYATRTEPLQRVLVTVPKELLDSDDGPLSWDPKLEVSNKAQPKPSDHIWSDKLDQDPAKVFTDITVQMTLGPKLKIVVPLAGDKLQLDKAKLPKGWALVEVQP